jgi:hypothetical protein
MTRTARLPRSRTENLVVRELDDETLVYDMERNEALCLNLTSAMVWQHCDGAMTASQSARLLQSKLNVPVDTDLVLLAVKQLERFHLVESSLKTPAVSRRKLILKYAPAALALPVILSISAPIAAQAASCAGQGQPCGQIPCCPGFNCDGICFPN